MANLFTVQVPAGATVAVDTTAMADFMRAHYQVAVYNKVELKNRAFDMLVVNEFTTVSDQVSNRRGTALNISVSAAKISTNMILSVTNGEAFALYVGFIKILI
jgi:hypothetical protein